MLVILVALLCAVALMLLAGASRAEAPGPAHPTVIDIDVAEVSFAAGEPAQEVTLPDTWGRRGLPTAGRAHYRVSFDLAAVPDQTWALRATAMSTRHEVRLNGQVISGRSHQAEPLARTRPQPEWVLLPPALLKPGRNTLDLALSYGALGGLSQLQVGAADQLAGADAVDRLLRYTLPITLNVSSLLVSLMMMLLYRRHRGEVLIGAVAALAAFGAVRNLLEFAVQGLPKHPVGDWVNHCIQLAGLVLLCHGFSLTSLGALRAWARASGWIAAALALVAAVALPLQAFGAVRNVNLGIMHVLAFVFVLASPRHITWTRQHTRPAVWAGLALAHGAAVHDFLFHIGTLDMDSHAWLPFALPLGFTVAGWALLNRTARTLLRTFDLTRELERRIEERTASMQQAVAAKSRFLAAASHDLRQPVVTIGLLVGLLREQLTEPGHQLMVDRVDQAVSAMEDLLRGLLDLSRLEAGTMVPRRQRVSLQKLFDAIAAHEGETARQKGLSLRFRACSLAVNSDPVLLDQILRNLVSNALRYTDKGGVLVGCRQRGGQVWVQVWDTGRGIAPDRQAAVFEEFVQLDNQARDRTRGLGLGLAIVNRSARLLGHRLSLQSKLGRGSCISIELPCTAAVQSPAGPPVTNRQPLQGLRVAVIEDEPGVRQALTDRLQYWGAEVTASDGLLSMQAQMRAHLQAQAHQPAQTTTHVPVQMAATGPRWIDLIISDQRLPDGTGVDVIAWIRQRQGATPAVLVTGNTDPDELTQMHHVDAPVLHKPFRADALLLRIRESIGRSGTI